MASSFRNLVAVFVIGCVPLSLPAADEPSRTVRVSVFSVDAVEPGALAIVTGPSDRERLLPLTMFPGAKSATYEYVGNGVMQIVETATRRPVSVVEFPEDMTDAFLILQSVAGAQRLKAIVLDDSVTKHRLGQLVVLNLTGHELSGTLGRRQVRLPTGYSGPFDVGPSVKISMTRMLNSRSYHVYGDTIKVPRDSRAILLLLPAVYRGSVEARVALLVDSPVRPPSEKK
jgi:hypothetical protein